MTLGIQKLDSGFVGQTSISLPYNARTKTVSVSMDGFRDGFELIEQNYV